MRLAWCATPDAISVVDDRDALREMASASERPGVAWWIGNRHEPTSDEAAARAEPIVAKMFARLEAAPRSGRSDIPGAAGGR